MKKTPDEIKKGLDDPIHVHYHISDIEPRLTPLALHDLEFLHADALALIQQLQKDKADMLEERELNDYLRDRVKQLEAERNAAVADMAEIVGCPCGVCKHYLKDGRKEPCNSCRNIRRGEESHFEWRGAQKE